MTFLNTEKSYDKIIELFFRYIQIGIIECKIWLLSGKIQNFKDSFDLKFKVNWLNINNTYVVRCVIWYQMYNLKDVKITHGGVLLLVKLQD